MRLNMSEKQPIYLEITSITLPGELLVGEAVTIDFKQRRSAAEVFTDIHDQNYWQGSESKSGTGSDMDKARIICTEITAMVNSLGADEIVDVGCGDWNWMSRIPEWPPEGVTYHGVDVVPKLIIGNAFQYSRSNVSFHVADLLCDSLPNDPSKKTLILCRDVFIHLPNRSIKKALTRIKKSGASWLAASTYEGSLNIDIKLGDFRTIDLQASPFNIGDPLVGDNLVIDERHIDPRKFIKVWKLK